MRFDAGPVDQLERGTPVVVTAGRRRIALVRWGDEVYAVHGVCPHMQTTFALGSVFDRPYGYPGEVEFAEDDPVMTCPWHQWEYRLRDGLCLADKKLRLRTYDVEVVDGRVLVDTEAPARKRPGKRGVTPLANLQPACATLLPTLEDRSSLHAPDGH